MSYYLVKFLDDGVLYICHEKQIKNGARNLKMVRYKNMGTYKARILAKGDKRKMERKYRNLTSTPTHLYHLVQFIEDRILYVCRDNQIKAGLHTTTKMVRYMNKGYYEANIIATGEKQEMDEVLLKMSSEKSAKKSPVKLISNESIVCTFTESNEQIVLDQITPSDEPSEGFCREINNEPTTNSIFLDTTSDKSLNLKSYTLEKPHCLPNTGITGTDALEIKMKSNKICRKQHCCPFCEKLQYAFGRHILSVHKTEDEIQQILILPKQCPERKKNLAKLRGKGMHIYNTKYANEASVIVVRQPKINKSVNFVPCPNCEAYFLPRNVARHQKTCTGRPPNRSRILSIAKNIKEGNKIDSILVQKLLSHLQQDDVTETIRQDKTLLLLATSMSIKYAKEKHLGNFMRQKLRQLARLLQSIKEIDNEINDFESCLIPAKYDTVKNAIYKLCELDTDTFTYKKPSLASQLGTMLKDCINLLKVDNIKKGLRNSHRQEQLQDFLLIHEKEYGSLVARSAVNTLEQNKWNKCQVLPSIEDIKCFQNYLKLRADTSYSLLLHKGFEYNHWLTLSKCCLLLLLTFNRRRVGETSRILLENYENRQSITKDQYSTLNRLERILANTFQRIEIRGKKGRRVPILLTSAHIEYIEIIFKYRSNAGVPKSNMYLFGCSHVKGYIDGGIAIRDYAIKCGASDPATIRGTHLRKQVATISQILNLNDNEIQQLADFMGHDIAIHRLHYRKPEINLQITRLSKFFMAAAEIDIEKYKGKSLDELEIITSKNKTSNSSDEENDDSDEQIQNTKSTAINSGTRTPKKNKILKKKERHYATKKEN